MNFEILQQIVETITDLKEMNPASFDEVEACVSVYNKGDDYCDFTYGSNEGDVIIEGCFCKESDGKIKLSSSFTALSGETGQSIMEIE